MKFFLILFLLISSVIFYSCDSTENSILTAENSKVNFSDPTDPNKNDTEPVFQITKRINGLIGGEILIDTTLVNKHGDSVRIETCLRIDSLSFQGQRDITIIPDINDASIQFFPEMNFNREIKLQLVYTGIQLKDLGFDSNCKVDFIFICTNGEYEPINYSFCTINWPQQQLRVSNAKLSHFSRYGFVRKSL
jgi:hypothetical protein